MKLIHGGNELPTVFVEGTMLVALHVLHMGSAVLKRGRKKKGGKRRGKGREREGEISYSASDDTKVNIMISMSQLCLVLVLVVCVRASSSNGGLNRHFNYSAFALI